jgi:hypothetical protein
LPCSYFRVRVWIVDGRGNGKIWKSAKLAWMRQRRRRIADQASSRMSSPMLCGSSHAFAITGLVRSVLVQVSESVRAARGRFVTVTLIPGAGFRAWFEDFLADRSTRKPSAHTMKAYRQDFVAIAAGLNATGTADAQREAMTVLESVGLIDTGRFLTSHAH